MTISISQETKNRRVALGMSHQDVADKSGLHVNTVLKIEEGGEPVHSYSIIKSLADAFDVKIHQMAGEPIYDVRPTVLMSSASMPNDGFYYRQTISIDQFIRIVRGAWLTGNMTSYVGYKFTARYVERITGAKVLKTRKETALSHKNTTCQVAVCKLRFRLSDKVESYTPHEDDMEYLKCLYNPNQFEAYEV